MDSEQETAARVDLDVLMEQMRGYPPTRITEAIWGWMEAQGFREKAHTLTDGEREARAIVRRAVGGVLFHVTNFPERAQSHLLGENMGPLNEKITEAVLAALGLPVSRDLVRRVDVALSVIAHEGGDVRVKQALDYVKAAFANQSLILDFVAPEPQGAQLPEPSSDHFREATKMVSDIEAEIRKAYVHPDGIFAHYGVETRAKAFDAWRASLAEPQGEPSDAQALEDFLGKLAGDGAYTLDFTSPEALHGHIVSLLKRDISALRAAGIGGVR